MSSSAPAGGKCTAPISPIEGCSAYKAAAVAVCVLIKIASPLVSNAADFVETSLNGARDDIGYSTAKLVALAHAALPMFIGFAVVHAALFILLSAGCGRWNAKDGRSGPNTVAYNMVVLAFDLMCVYIGACSLADGSMARLGMGAHERLFGFSADALALCALTAGFELYNTIVCVFVLPTGFEFIAHHALTFGLAFMGVAPFVHFYSLFFFGLANLSSIPLAAFIGFDALRVKFPSFEHPYTICQAAFAVLFLLVRCAIWPCISLRFWIDTYIAVASGWPQSILATSSLLLSNAFLTGLQFMWGKKVLRNITSKFGLNADKKIKAKDCAKQSIDQSPQAPYSANIDGARVEHPYPVGATS